MSPTASKTGQQPMAREETAGDRFQRNGKGNRMAINLVFLLGNLTRDPVLRRIPNGNAVADIGLAINEEKKTRDGETEETVTFLDVVAWGRQAEACAEYLRKGSSVFVEGRLQRDEWTDKEGNKKMKIKVRAERIQFMSRPAPKRTDPDEETAE